MLALGRHVNASAGPSRVSVSSSSRTLDDQENDFDREVPGSEDGRSGSKSEDDYSDEEDAEDYEMLRLKRIKENELLLGELGIHTSLQARASSSSQGPIATPPIRTKKQRVARPPVYDRSGYIISQPGPGQTFRMACVEMPSDRKVRKRISDGEYQDCSQWAEGEDRRWRLGDGEGSFEAGEEVLIGGVGPDFRWRKWRGLKNELRREMRLRGDLNEMDMRVTRSTAAEGVSDYSMIPGNACHQCRRKSEKLKMKCRNTDKECNAVFCETCCKRYNYFDFDPDSRSFICPLCRDVCNCSNCIRKRDLAHLLDSDGLKRAKSLRFTLRKEGKGELTVQEWLEEAAYQTLRAPFDRVRIINADEDVVSPELPLEPEPMIEAVRPKKVKKTKSSARGGGGGPKGVKKGKKGKTAGSAMATSPEQITLKFSLPRPRSSTSPVKKPVPIRPKEVDSDGDTVNGWSGDEDQPDQPVASGSRSRTSTITPLSSRDPTPQPRLAFPPRPQAVTPNYSSFTPNGYVHPAMVKQPLLSSSPLAPFRDKDATATVTSEETSTTVNTLNATRKRKAPSPNLDARLPKKLQHDEIPPGFFQRPPSPEPLVDFADQEPRAFAHTVDQDAGYTDDRNPYPNFASLFQQSNGSAMLSAQPPPYSHSPPRRLQALGSPSRSDSFLPPAPMAYSLAQHLQASSDNP